MVFLYSTLLSFGVIELPFETGDLASCFRGHRVVTVRDWGCSKLLLVNLKEYVGLEATGLLSLIAYRASSYL